MNLKDYIPKPHPTKKIFHQYGFPLAAVAKYLDRTYSYVSQILSGTAKATSEIDAKLHALADALQKEQGLSDERGNLYEP